MASGWGPSAFAGGGHWISASLIHITQSPRSPPTMPHWWSDSVPSSSPPTTHNPCHPPLGCQCSLRWSCVCDKHVWWASVTCHVCTCDLGCLCVHAGVCAVVCDTSAGLCCYQIDMSVYEALLFSDVPHTGSWSLCVCACACLPSSASLETDGPWHLPFGRFSLWKMSSSSDPTCVCVCVCLWERDREMVHPSICLPEVKICSWLNNGHKLFEQPGQTNLCVCACVCVWVLYEYILGW